MLAFRILLWMEVKNRLYGRVSDYAQRTGVRFEAGVRPWHVPVDVALPCASQNELDVNDTATKNIVTKRQPIQVGVFVCPRSVWADGSSGNAFRIR